MTHKLGPQGQQHLMPHCVPVVVVLTAFLDRNVLTRCLLHNIPNYLMNATSLWLAHLLAFESPAKISFKIDRDDLRVSEVDLYGVWILIYAGTDVNVWRAIIQNRVEIFMSNFPKQINHLGNKERYGRAAGLLNFFLHPLRGWERQGSDQEGS